MVLESSVSETKNVSQPFGKTFHVYYDLFSCQAVSSSLRRYAETKEKLFGH